MDQFVIRKLGVFCHHATGHSTAHQGAGHQGGAPQYGVPQKGVPHGGAPHVGGPHAGDSPHGHPGGSTKGHPLRSPMHCFFILESGTVLVEIGEKTYMIKERDLVIIPSGQLFSIRFFENARGYMGGFSTQFISGQHSSENAISRYDFLRIWGSPKIELSEKDYSRQLPLFDRIYEESASEVPDMEIIKTYLCTVLTEADAIYRKTVDKVRLHNNSISNRFLEKLFKGDQDHTITSVSEFADLLNVTPNHLNKVVKGTTGKSPSKWIEEYVILKAKLLLRCTTLPMNEIAAKAGILDQSYFARKFRQHEGVTPSEYRNGKK